MCGKEVLKQLSEVGLKLKPSMCEFGLQQIELLGYSVSGSGTALLTSKMQALSEMEIPSDVLAIHSFLGMTRYYRKCIPNFAEKALPLIELTG